MKSPRHKVSFGARIVELKRSWQSRNILLHSASQSGNWQSASSSSFTHRTGEGARPHMVIVRPHMVCSYD